MSRTTDSLPDPLATVARRSALRAIAVVLLAAMVGASVRLLPWVLDPTLSWNALMPFAKSLFSMAVEAAILVGWPVGWALAAARLVERGEARVLAMLGESPIRSILRLRFQALAFGIALAATSLLSGRDSSAPGRVVNALIEEGKNACASTADGATFGVPFVSATWLCSPAHASLEPAEGKGEPRLVGKAPVGAVVFSARNAHVTDDLRRIDLDDARLTIPTSSSEGGEVRVLRVQVGSLSLRGLAPWARASSLPALYRAWLVTLSGIVAACGAAYGLFRLGPTRMNGVIAAAIGAAGPLAALFSLRGLEVRLPEGGAPGLGVVWTLLLFLVPVSAAIAVGASTALATVLPLPRRAGTK